ncbi:uncharacterized protein LOC123865875 [Maniola jurtina]|uniref:uncharacterized protein LOC123865875 n=1 Tax=Maniola jurtina TaxID=191418 RepID=UPI001E68C038|nr:uncharacterized protein LOC123865875 [Maniola jurtina]
MESVLNFVQIIEQYPCLYNNTLPDYSRKDIVDKAWNEVAEAMQWTVHYCQSKWKNIRNGFVRSLKLCADGSSKKQKKLYYLHNELQFILPYIKTNIHTEEAGNSSPQDASREEAYSPFEEESVIIPEGVSSPAAVLNAFKKAKYRKIETEVDWLKEREFNKDDTRKMFLFSLLSDVETLSDEQMREFRIKVLLLLEEVRTSPPQNNLSQHQRQYQQYRNSLQYPVESTLSMLKTEISDETDNTN